MDELIVAFLQSLILYGNGNEQMTTLHIRTDGSREHSVEPKYPDTEENREN